MKKCEKAGMACLPPGFDCFCPPVYSGGNRRSRLLVNFIIEEFQEQFGIDYRLPHNTVLETFQACPKGHTDNIGWTIDRLLTLQKAQTAEMIFDAAQLPATGTGDV